jgi:serine/threonine protein kinase/formylglycine-generating enzyme required for sulfatase activity
MTDIEIFMNAPADATAEVLSDYLNRMCGEDTDLRARVESLIAADRGAGPTFMGHALASGLRNDEPLRATGPEAETCEALSGRAAPIEEGRGDIIGRYKLLQEIGAGGFGTVWMAQQTEPVSRRVALKIIKRGMDTREVIARFEAERQALAMMDHPNIAKVLDAGGTNRGRPFFVMELVRGVPITQYCNDKQLGTHERLALFSDVCAGINHAHQKGIIHRDIKPSNIMVTLHEDKPVVKVIDFGIAKAVQGKLTEKTLFTRLEQFIGTPVYMSPEQAGLNVQDVDTRSDIYSLGILLYELLTGKPPFDARTLASAGFEEMRRIIREEDPPTPSTRLETLAHEERTVVAKSHGTDSRHLTRLVHGELDWIVMKAIEKDRSRRYETANAFALDIGRYLRDEPISAAAPSVVYRFRKFARRNKHSLATIAAILTVAAVGAGVALVQESGNRQERAEALLQSLFDARTDHLPALIERMVPHASRLDGKLQTVAESADQSPRDRARARLALVSRHPEHLAPLGLWMLEAPPDELGIYLGMLDHRKPELAGIAWSAIGDEQAEESIRLHAVVIGAFADPGNPRWEGLADQIVGWLAQPGAGAAWLPALHLLQPLADRLDPALQALFRDEGNATAGLMAARILSERDSGDLEALVVLAKSATPLQISIVVDVMNRNPAIAEAILARELSAAPAEGELPDKIRERARLGVALLLMKSPDNVWPQFAHQSVPDLRTRLIHDLAPSGVNWRVLEAGLKPELHPGVITANLSAFGEYDTAQLPKSLRALRLRPQLEELYSSHDDSGVRSSAEWLLRKWGLDGSLVSLDAEIRTGKVEGTRRGYVTKGGDFTMAILPSPIEFTMGSSEQEREEAYEMPIKRPTNESEKPITIERTIAVATKEVVRDQFMEFARQLQVPAKTPAPPGWQDPVSRTGDAAMGRVALKEAMLFCWWFTRKEGIPDDQQCYSFEGKFYADAPARTVEGYLDKTGYRLLTEAEWEFACRGGTKSPRYFGSDESLLPDYAWFIRNGEDHTWQPGHLRPNPFGLFDMLGNVAEWCQEPYLPKYVPHATGTVVADDDSQKHDKLGVGAWRCFRGGSFLHNKSQLRSAWRNNTPYQGHPFTGFRIARTMPSED